MVGWGECPSSVFYLGLKEGWKRAFSKFWFSFSSEDTCISVYGVCCSMEEYEMLLPDKPSYKCWKPVQREQRRLLFSSQ